MGRLKAAANGVSMAILALTVGACGLRTPDMVVSPGRDPTLDFVNKVVAHFKSELGCAVIGAIDYARKDTTTPYAYKWLDTATAKMSLILSADDNSSVSPDLIITDPISEVVTAFAGKGTVSTPRSFALGVGGGLSADANRKDTSDYTISIKDAFVDHEDDYRPGAAHCKPYGGYFLEGSLRLDDWLRSRLFPYENIDLRFMPPQTLQTDITFTITATGNVSPAWKLHPVAFSPSGSLFSTGRKNIDEIIITISANATDATVAQNIAKQGAFNQPR
jgi:hypothetical protein